MNYWFQILKNSKSLAFLIIITFLITLMGLLSPIFIIHIFNRYIAFGLQGTLMFLLLGALSVAVFEFIFRNIRNNIFNKILQRPIKELKRELIKKFFENEHKNNTSISVVEILDFKNNLFQFLSPKNQSNIFDSIFVILIIVVLFFLNYLLACLFLIIVFIHLFLQNRINSLKAEHLRKSGIGINDQIIIKEVGTNNDLIKSNSAINYTGHFIENFFEKKINIDSIISSYDSKQVSLSNFFMLLSSIIIIGVGSIFVVMGNLTIGALIGFNIFSSRAIGILTSAQNSFINLTKINNYFENYKVYFKNSSNRNKGMQLSKVLGLIESKNLDFSYTNNKNFIFRNLSFELVAQHINIIKGNNGSGKTTLAKLLLGLVSPNSGEILIDRTNLEKLSMIWYRKQIAYIPQNCEILSSSINDNILIGNNKLNDQEIGRLLQTVGLDNELKNSDLTLNEPINFNISKGISKKIHIARALAHNPPIFLFDDPFIFLDNNGREILKNLLVSLKRSGKTIICLTDDKLLDKISDNEIILGN